MSLVEVSNSNNINIDDKCLIYIRHDDKVFSLYNS